MSVDTTKIEGRRTLHFATLDDILADVERLNQGKIRALGNWSPGQVLRHLMVPMRWCLDGTALKAPWYVRFLSVFFKKGFLRNPMPAGFKLSADFAAELEPSGPAEWEAELNAFRAMIGRLKAEPQRYPSPFLGAMTREQWDQLHCRHAELHLSFLIPEG